MGHNPLWIVDLRPKSKPNGADDRPDVTSPRGHRAIPNQCVADRAGLGQRRRIERGTSGSKGNNVGLHGAPLASLILLHT